MLTFYSTVGALMVPWDIRDADAKDSAEVPPEVSLEGIAVVADDRLTSSVSTQPSTNKSITTFK